MDEHIVPQEIFHYYNIDDGPFHSISKLSQKEANKLYEKLKCDKRRFASKRDENYLPKRKEIESRIRNLFNAKGGKPINRKPYYFVLGECKWLLNWYPKVAVLSVPLAEIDTGQISFTYGDSFPTFYYEDGRPYRKQVFIENEIQELITEYGLPQYCNAEEKDGPDRYIEAQLWSDTPIQKYLLKVRV
jgi:hypothetical protein